MEVNDTVPAFKSNNSPLLNACYVAGAIQNALLSFFHLILTTVL